MTVFPCGTVPPRASNLNFDRRATVSNNVVTYPDQAGRVCFFTSAPAHLAVDVMGFAGLHPVTPSRLMDTRTGEPTADRLGQGIGKRAAGTTTELWVTGRGDVLADAIAAAITVTVTQPETPGSITVLSCDGDPPNVSNATCGRGATVASTVVVPLSPRGTVCIYTLANTHVVVDLNGYDLSFDRFTGVGPVRLMDTRIDGATSDGIDRPIGLRPAGSTTEIQATGRFDIPSGVVAVILSLTVTETGVRDTSRCGRAEPLARRHRTSTTPWTAPSPTQWWCGLTRQAESASTTMRLPMSSQTSVVITPGPRRRASHKRAAAMKT